MVGLGRMGSGMTERLRRHGLEVMSYDPKVDSTAGSLEETRQFVDDVERGELAKWMASAGG